MGCIWLSDPLKDIAMQEGDEETIKWSVGRLIHFIARERQLGLEVWRGT